MVDEDYEIISHKEVAKLKGEIKELRQGKLTGSTNDIKTKLNEMLGLFREASLSIKKEKPLSEKLSAINEKLEKVLD